MLYPAQNITPIGKLTLVESLLKQKQYTKALDVYQAHIAGVDLGERFDDRVMSAYHELDQFSKRESRRYAARNRPPLNASKSKSNLLESEASADKPGCDKEEASIKPVTENVQQSGGSMKTNESRSNLLESKSIRSSATENQPSKLASPAACPSGTVPGLKKTRSRSSLSRVASTSSLVCDGSKRRRPTRICSDDRPKRLSLVHKKENSFEQNQEQLVCIKPTANKPTPIPWENELPTEGREAYLYNGPVLIPWDWDPTVFDQFPMRISLMATFPDGTQIEVPTTWDRLVDIRNQRFSLS